jgi:hypothetical protein
MHNEQSAEEAIDEVAGTVMRNLKTQGPAPQAIRRILQHRGPFDDIFKVQTVVISWKSLLLPISGVLFATMCYTFQSPQALLLLMVSMIFVVWGAAHTLTTSNIQSHEVKRSHLMSFLNDADSSKSTKN